MTTEPPKVLLPDSILSCIWQDRLLLTDSYITGHQTLSVYDVSLQGSVVVFLCSPLWSYVPDQYLMLMMQHVQW